jgi:hypothetical protein
MKLRTKCSCGGNIEIITYREDEEESPNYNKICVSHGICEECGKVEIMENESVTKYIRYGLVK